MPDQNDTTTGTIALIFGILGCFGVGACWGSLIAIIMGRSARGTAGESNGRIGSILGWITLCIPLIVFAVYVILVFAIWGGSWAFWGLP